MYTTIRDNYGAPRQSNVPRFSYHCASHHRKIRGHKFSACIHFSQVTIHRGNSYQFGLALNLIIQRKLCIYKRPVVPAPPSRRHYPSFPKIVFYSPRRTHVCLLSRCFGSEWACWITTCSPPTGEWNPHSTGASVDTVRTAIARATITRSIQETDCEAAQ